MSRLTLRYCLLLLTGLLAIAENALGQGSLTGSWGGTYTVTEAECPPNFTYSGSVSMTLFQEGSSVAGIVVFDNVPTVENCLPTGDHEIFGANIEATVSGNRIVGRIIFEEEGEEDVSEFEGTVSGDTIAVTFDDPMTGGGSLTVSRQEAPFAGFFRGTYSFTKTLGCGAVQYNGTFEATTVQFGSLMAGPVTLTGVKDVRPDCSFFQEPPLEGVMFGFVSGNFVSGEIHVDGDEDGDDGYNFSGTISGNQLTGTLTQPNGNGTFTLTTGVPPPSISSFDASPKRIRAGESATLFWSTSGAASVTIDNGVGVVPVNGSVRVTPASTTTYTLVAMNGSGGRSVAQVTIEVVTAPSVAISVFPNGLLQEANSGGATDRFVVTNNGGSATTITLTQNGNFFTQSPSPFTLTPGASQVVTITGIAQPPGTIGGASVLSGNGVPPGLSVPIRLLSVVPPTVQVTADALEDRVDLSAIGATNPSGSTRMFNNSSIALTGIVVSDVPWIIPPTAAVTIPAGGTVTISFTIDRTKRPDASAPIGSLSGNLTLAYLSGAGAGARQSIRPLETTSVNQFTSVKIVDTASVAANPSSLGPLAPGQLALFAPGMTRRSEGAAVLKSDVAFSNVSSLNLAGLSAFFTPGVGFSAISTLANIPQIASNQPLAFSDLVKSLYNAEGQDGTLQVRAADTVVRNLTVSAVVVNTNDPQGAVGTVLPVFRSDRVGSSVTLTGLRPETTNLILQETSSANNTSVRIDFYNASGNPVGAGRTELLERFKMRELSNAVPATAVSAVLTSAGSGTFAAYGAVQDTSGRGDDLAIVDWPGYYGYATSQPVLVPVAGGSSSTRQRGVRRGSAGPVDKPGDYRRTDVTIMNVGTATASGKLVYYSASGQPLERQLSLASREARQIDDVTAFVGAKNLGYVIFQPEGGSFVVTARATTSTGLSATVPSIATRLAMKAGEVHKVGGLEDASQSSISKKRGSTSRTDLGLIETAGQPVTVRITLHYSFAASDRVGARGSASREYTLQARQMLMLNRISRELLGAGRDQTFGDMRDLQLEFAIVDGDGEVIPFTSSIDNGSGDAFVRVD